MRIRIALVAASVAVSIIITIPALTARSATAAVVGTSTPAAKGDIPAREAERAAQRTRKSPSRVSVRGPTHGTAAVTVATGTLARVANSKRPGGRRPAVHPGARGSPPL